MVVIVLICLVACDEMGEGEAPEWPRLRAVEVLRIGSVDDPLTSLTTISALEIGPDGRIYTLHRRERRVGVHASDGTPLESFGSEGGGPGEFLRPVSMGLAGDEIWVLDADPFRANYFALDGTFLRSVVFKQVAYGYPLWVAPRPSRVVIDGTVVAEQPRQQVAGALELTGSPVLRLAQDGSIVDTIFVRSLTNHDLATYFSGEGPSFEPQPFGDYPFYSVSLSGTELVMVDRTVPVDTSTFAVTKIGIGADTIWHREYRFDPIPLTPETIDTFIVRRREQHVQYGFASSLRQAEDGMRSNLFTPDYLPAASAVRVGHDGSVWVALADLEAASTPWLVLRADGDVVGEVVLPARFTILHPAEDSVWGMIRDELDVPYIVQYSIDPTGELADDGG